MGRTWFSQIDLSLPFWQDYRHLVLHLREVAGEMAEFPSAADLQKIPPDEMVNRFGKAVRFLPSESIPGIRYEEHIYQTGEVSTREHSWHDLFNALVWARFPRVKSAMNAMHYQEIQRQSGSLRGPPRDALTLFDECGVIVASANAAALAALARRDWNAAFQQNAPLWQESIRVFVCGHALLEKFLNPYKALTAHALLVHIDPGAADENREKTLKMLDGQLDEKLLSGTLLDSPAALSPLPLMGIPGWWPHGPQNGIFYTDRQVFRQPVDGFSPAPVFDLAGLPDHQAMP